MYPFHPLFGKRAIVVAEREHNGAFHITVRPIDGPADGATSFLPVWMVEKGCPRNVVDTPTFSIDALLDLRAFLDSVDACDICKKPKSGEANANDGSGDTTRFVSDQYVEWAEVGGSRSPRSRKAASDPAAGSPDRSGDGGGVGWRG